MEEIKFSVEGVPRSCPRPRFSRRYGGVQAYLPESYKIYCNSVIEGAKKASFAKCLEGNVAVNVIFRRARKNSDIDNMTKAILDCLTKAGVIRDDKYITCLTARKVPAENAGVDVTVKLDD